MHNIPSAPDLKLPRELHETAQRPMTREQVIQQKISFVRGTVKNPPSDEEIRQMIYEQEGYPEGADPK